MISSSQRVMLGSIGSASIILCLRFRISLWILRSLYAVSHTPFARAKRSCANIRTTQVENEVRSSLPQKAGASPEQLSGVEETILKLSGQVSTLVRQQKYFRTRENRNFSTVRSTEGRIFRFSLIESGLMVAMAGLQVFIVKMFFTGGRKGESSDVLCAEGVGWVLISLQGTSELCCARAIDVCCSSF